MLVNSDTFDDLKFGVGQVPVIIDDDLIMDYENSCMFFASSKLLQFCSLFAYYINLIIVWLMLLSVELFDFRIKYDICISQYN